MNSIESNDVHFPISVNRVNWQCCFFESKVSQNWIWRLINYFTVLLLSMQLCYVSNLSTNEKVSIIIYFDYLNTAILK